jgi:hypothetical protein
MKVSCLATDGRHLGSGLVTRQIRKSEPKILFCARGQPKFAQFTTVHVLATSNQVSVQQNLTNIADYKNEGSEVCVLFKWLPRHFTLLSAPQVISRDFLQCDWLCKV